MWIPLVFICGYIFIVFEHRFHINKAAAALLAGIICWGLFLNSGEGSRDAKFDELTHHLAAISQILFYLIGAMTIVEVVNTHKGFDLIGTFFKGRSSNFVYWAILFISFFLSAVLDNLTTIIVMVSLLRPIIPSTEHRKLLCAGLVMAVNAGGAWTPIGDVTTTMLWIEGVVTSSVIISKLFIPSIVTIIVFGLIHRRVVGQFSTSIVKIDKKDLPAGSIPILILGVLSLIMVPILKGLLDIPPYLGILFGAAVMWLVTDLLHHQQQERQHLRVLHVLTKIDMGCVLFFLGILLMVDALESAGFLQQLAIQISQQIPSIDYLAIVIGLVSAVVDNVPLVAACIKMFQVVYPVNHSFWTLTAFAAGTGGSILIIGSAPGVALMSMEDVSFWWYFRHAGWIALIAYGVGIAACLAG